MTKQLDIWKSAFGKDWTDRTNIDPKTRVEAFRKVMSSIGVNTILEVGCNKGYNLVAISQTGYYSLFGIDPIEHAIRQVNRIPLMWKFRSWNCPIPFIGVCLGNCFDIPFANSYFDLVFTCGVLMHVAPKDLSKAIEEMKRVSKRYVLMIEYWAKDETMVPYRGHEDLLFKRDYRKEGERMELKCVAEGVLDKEDGFDDTNWWLFEKLEVKDEK